MDINKIPKQFCENIGVAYTPEFFILALMAGESATTFALTPAHAKRLMQYITHQVAEYEKVNGKISGEDWNPGIKSPIQLPKN